ncbi:MAG: type pilus biosis protein type pilus assembly protein PilE [Candidatus Saccharibacteria bacterium]|nr:type pilus biosis protein type pilus assembly protein PilE [Candidatus Saccharibacteria bacterium]
MHVTQKNKLGSKGFTLIELLIVIIIIGILAAIAFVAYSGSQNKANKAAAESTLSQVKNKLGEYNATNSNYPTTQAALNTWMTSSDGGNNTSLASKFVTPNYTYTPDNGSGGACDNSATPCTGYTVTANKSLFAGSADLTQKN